MSQEEALSIFSSIIESAEPEKLIRDLLSIISDLEEDTIKDLIEKIRAILYSKKKSTSPKLQVIRTLKSLMQTKLPSIIAHVHKRIIQGLPDIVIFKDNCTGFELWQEALKVKDNSGFKFIILALQCIEIWGELHSNDCKGKETLYCKVYQQLKSRKIEFPPSFFLQPLSPLPKTHLKRDLHRVRKLSKQLIREIRFMDKQNAISLKKILNSYEKALQFEIENQQSIANMVHESVLLTLKDIEEAKELFEKWKSVNFCSMPEEGIYACVGVLIEDPLPKEEPFEEDEEDIGGKARARERERERERSKSPAIPDLRANLSKSFLGYQSEMSKLKEKLLDSQDLIDKYQADLSKIQTDYSSVVEERDVLLRKVEDLTESNQILEKSLAESKSLVEEITRKKSYLQKDIEAYNHLNKMHRTMIQELQETCFHLEKDSNHNKTYIENIENANVLLVATNQTLRIELERCKAPHEDFRLITRLGKGENGFPTPCPLSPVYLQPLEVHTQSIITLSDFEPDRICSSDEDDKQTPNFTAKFNPKNYLRETIRNSSVYSEADSSRTDKD